MSLAEILMTMSCTLLHSEDFILLWLIRIVKPRRSLVPCRSLAIGRNQHDALTIDLFTIDPSGVVHTKFYNG